MSTVTIQVTPDEAGICGADDILLPPANEIKGHYPQCIVLVSRAGGNKYYTYTACYYPVLILSLVRPYDDAPVLFCYSTFTQDVKEKLAI